MLAVGTGLQPGLFTGHNPSGQEVPNILRVESGVGQEVVRTLTCRNRWGQEVFQSHRFGSGHPDPTRPNPREVTGLVKFRGWVKQGLLTGHDPDRPARRIRRLKKNTRIESGRIRRCFEIAWVGLRGFQTPQDGSGHPGPNRPARSGPTREKPWLKLLELRPRFRGQTAWNLYRVAFAVLKRVGRMSRQAGKRPIIVRVSKPCELLTAKVVRVSKVPAR